MNMFSVYRDRPYRKLNVLTKWKIFSGLFRRTYQKRKGEQVIDRNGFLGEWDKSVEEWDRNEERNLGDTFGGYDRDGNHEIEE